MPNLYQIQNQIPASLDPNYAKLIRLKDPGQPVELLTKNLSAKLFTSSNTKISYKNKNLAPKDITQLFLSCLTGQIDPHSEKLAKTLLSQTALNYQTASSLLFKNCYAQMAAEQAKLPMPSVNAIYTVNTDVIPQSKAFLAGQTSKEALFASFAFTFKPSCLGIAFKNEQDFNNFKQTLNSYIKARPNLDPAIVNKANDFAKEKLSGLTDNLLLRQNDTDDQNPYAFSRILVKLLMLDPNTVLMPFDLGELYNPTKLILINLDSHAHSMPSAIKQTWREINQACQTPFKMLSNSKLMHLPKTGRISNAIKQQAMQLKQNQHTGLARGIYRPLSKTKPSNKWLTQMVMLKLNHMAQVVQSSNTYRIQHRTFNRANRRHPDDYNLPGRSVRTVYRPDIHIYLDTSGSISEENYQAAIKTCIMLAKRLNVDLYFNSFSHYLSSCYKLPTKGRTLSQIYALFEMIPKVTGGTEYSNVWHYITHNKTRQKEFSLLITDFEYYVPDTNFDHPRNLYYAPIDTTPGAYRYIYDSAKDFLAAMNAAGHPIRNQILL